MGATAEDGTLAAEMAAVVVEGVTPARGGGLGAGEEPDLGHEREEGGEGADALDLAEAIDFDLKISRLSQLCFHQRSLVRRLLLEEGDGLGDETQELFVEEGLGQIVVLGDLGQKMSAVPDQRRRVPADEGPGAKAKKKRRRGGRRFPQLRYQLALAIVTIVAMIVVTMMAALAPAIVAVVPTVPSAVKPGSPDVFVVAIIIAAAVGVISTVTELDVEIDRLRGGREDHSRGHHGGDDKFVSCDHNPYFACDPASACVGAWKTFGIRN